MSQETVQVTSALEVQAGTSAKTWMAIYGLLSVGVMWVLAALVVGATPFLPESGGKISSAETITLGVLFPLLGMFGVASIIAAMMVRERRVLGRTLGYAMLPLAILGLPMTFFGYWLYAIPIIVFGVAALVGLTADQTDLYFKQGPED